MSIYGLEHYTGKNGIDNFEDAIDPDRQDFVAKDHFADKYEGMVRFLGEHGKTLYDYIGLRINRGECSPSLEPPEGVPEAVTITMSGLGSFAWGRGCERSFA